jgi:transcription elongation factor S-II
MTSILVLTQKAEVKSGKLNVEAGNEVTLETIQKYFKKKTEPEILGTYNYKTLTLFLFGYTSGKAGAENKHELPPPHDSQLVFGDIVLIASKSENSFMNPVSFKPEDYEVFYSKAYGGFDDLDEEDEEDEETNSDLIEEAIEEEAVIDDVIEEDDEIPEISDNTSYISEEEEIVNAKKERKKRNTNIVINHVNIHPDKQLNENSEKNSIRLKVIESLEKLQKSMGKKDSLTKKEIETLENEIYKVSLKEADAKHIIKDWSIKMFVYTYHSILRKIISNLFSNSYLKNTELMKRYKAKEVSLEEICSMNHYSLYESKWKERIENQKNIEKRRIEGNKSMATDQFLCTRCFKRECTYYEMQTRSADEPMTIFINCLNCGKNWRQ